MDWVGAARSAAVMAIPLTVAATTDYVVSGVFAAIGCLNILLLQLLGTARDRLVRSLWGLGLNTVAIGIGTWVGSLGWVEVPLVALGLIVLHLTNRIPRPGSLPLTVSALFVIGVGLPGGSPADAVSRVALVLIGGLLGVAGLALHIGLLRLRTPVGTGTAAWEPASPAPSSTAGVLPEWVHATAVGLTAAGGLAISLWAGLSRDYWIMLTAVVVLRTRFEETLSVGVSRMGGTVLGAAVGAIVTIGVIAPELQGVLAFLFTFGVFAFGRANYALYTLSLTAFVIVLLNLTYPSGVVLAETRILDTFIGGALALLAATVLWYLRYRPSAARSGASTG